MVNNRIIATPAWHAPLTKLTEARDLPPHARHEIEQFFVTATGKRLQVKGWATRRRTEKFVQRNLI